MKYDVTVIVGKRHTLVYEAADAADARAMAERGEAPLQTKDVHSKDEVVVVLEPSLTELELGDKAAKGVEKLMPRPGESEEDAHRRTLGQG